MKWGFNEQSGQAFSKLSRPLKATSSSFKGVIQESIFMTDIKFDKLSALSKGIPQSRTRWLAADMLLLQPLHLN